MVGWWGSNGARATPCRRGTYAGIYREHAQPWGLIVCSDIEDATVLPVQA